MEEYMIGVIIIKDGLFIRDSFVSKDLEFVVPQAKFQESLIVAAEKFKISGEYQSWIFNFKIGSKMKNKSYLIRKIKYILEKEKMFRIIKYFTW